MRIRAIPVVVMMVLAACSPAPEGATTTVGATSTSTSTTSTTTTLPPTTTTTLPPTTTTTLLEGNWADQPLVVIGDWGGMAVGWWDGSQWVQVEQGTSLPVSGGEDYQVALVGTEDRRTTGGPQVFSCVSGYEFPGVVLDDVNALHAPIDDGQGDRLGISGVAISAPWDLTPHHVGPGEAHPDLEAMAVSLLNDRGFDTESAQIVQTVDADLDGDGAIETIAVAEDTEIAPDMSGVYSLVFMVGVGLSQPIVVDESVIPADESGFPASLRVGAIADLSGDGLMEVAVDGHSWEGSGMAIFELVDDQFLNRIGVGCGA